MHLAPLAFANLGAPVCPRRFGLGSEYDTVAKQVLGCQDYYAIFELPKYTGVSESLLRGKFRKLCLKTHPDKSQARDADAAFKKLNDAYHTLTDDEKKQKYDSKLNGQVHAAAAAQQAAAQQTAQTAQDVAALVRKQSLGSLKNICSKTGENMGGTKQAVQERVLNHFGLKCKFGAESASGALAWLQEIIAQFHREEEARKQIQRAVKGSFNDPIGLRNACEIAAQAGLELREYEHVRNRAAQLEEAALEKRPRNNGEKVYADAVRAAAVRAEAAEAEAEEMRRERNAAREEEWKRTAQDQEQARREEEERKAVLRRQKEEEAAERRRLVAEKKAEEKRQREAAQAEARRRAEEAKQVAMEAARAAAAAAAEKAEEAQRLRLRPLFTTMLGEREILAIAHQCNLPTLVLLRCTDRRLARLGKVVLVADMWRALPANNAALAAALTADYVRRWITERLQQEEGAASKPATLRAAFEAASGVQLRSKARWFDDLAKRVGVAFDRAKQGAADSSDEELVASAGRPAPPGCAPPAGDPMVTATIGLRVALFWSAGKASPAAWHVGSVGSYGAKKLKHRIDYDHDGSRRWHDLRAEEWRVVGGVGEPPQQCGKAARPRTVDKTPRHSAKAAAATAAASASATAATAEAVVEELDSDDDGDEEGRAGAHGDGEEVGLDEAEAEVLLREFEAETGGADDEDGCSGDDDDDVGENVRLEDLVDGAADEVAADADVAAAFGEALGGRGGSGGKRGGGRKGGKGRKDVARPSKKPSTAKGKEAGAPKPKPKPATPEPPPVLPPSRRGRERRAPARLHSDMATYDADMDEEAAAEEEVEAAGDGGSSADEAYEPKDSARKREAGGSSEDEPLAKPPSKRAKAGRPKGGGSKARAANGQHAASHEDKARRAAMGDSSAGEEDEEDEEGADEETMEARVAKSASEATDAALADYYNLEAYPPDERMTLAEMAAEDSSDDDDGSEAEGRASDESLPLEALVAREEEAEEKAQSLAAASLGIMAGSRSLRRRQQLDKALPPTAMGSGAEGGDSGDGYPDKKRRRGGRSTALKPSSSRRKTSDFGADGGDSSDLMSGDEVVLSQKHASIIGGAVADLPLAKQRARRRSTSVLARGGQAVPAEAQHWDPVGADRTFVFPAFMEYQTDSDDSDATASRKQQLKAKVLAAKQQRAQLLAAEQAAAGSGSGGDAYASGRSEGGGRTARRSSDGVEGEGEEAEEGADFEVEKLLRERPPSKRSGVSEFQFLVRWAGFGEDEDTWEPESNLPAEMVGTFREAKEREKKAAAEARAAAEAVAREARLAVEAEREAERAKVRAAAAAKAAAKAAEKAANEARERVAREAAAAKAAAASAERRAARDAAARAAAKEAEAQAAAAMEAAGGAPTRTPLTNLAHGGGRFESRIEAQVCASLSVASGVAPLDAVGGASACDGPYVHLVLSTAAMGRSAFTVGATLAALPSTFATPGVEDVPVAELAGLDDKENMLPGPAHEGPLLVPLETSRNDSIGTEVAGPGAHMRVPMGPLSRSRPDALMAEAGCAGPAFAVGDAVLYTDPRADGSVASEIVAVHHDAEVAYYTIRTSGGIERQTEASRLRVAISASSVADAASPALPPLPAASRHQGSTAPHSSDGASRKRSRSLGPVDDKLVAKAVRAYLRKASSPATVSRKELRTALEKSLDADLDEFRQTIKQASVEFVLQQQTVA